jgi:hypothetical protein
MLSPDINIYLGAKRQVIWNGASMLSEDPYIFFENAGELRFFVLEREKCPIQPPLSYGDQV